MNNNNNHQTASDSSILLTQNKSDPTTIRILIVDDKNSICERLKLRLEPEADLAVVGVAEDGVIAIKQVEFLQPDVILMALEMTDLDGIKATQIIAKRFPDCQIIVLTTDDNNEYLNQAISAGAKGYLLKNTPAEELRLAIRLLSKGYSYLGQNLWSEIGFKTVKTDFKNEAKTNLKSTPNFSVSNGKENKLFRAKSLERLSSPERLDQLMQVVNPNSWLPLVTLGSLVVAAGVWSVFGRIPVTVEGRGVLIYPSKVVPLQAKGEGQLLDLKIQSGDTVKKGQVIASVNQIDLRKQLELAKAKLSQLQAQDREVGVVQNNRSDRDLESISEQRQTLEQRLQILQELTPVLKEKGLISIERDRENLQKRLQILTDLLPTYKKRLTVRQNLFAEGAISGDILLQARQEYFNNIANLNEIDSQLKQLDVKEADAIKTYLSNLNEIKNIKAQLQELNSKQANLAQQDLQTSNTRIKEIQEVEREIDRLQEQITNNSQIVSQHSGKILDITVNVGQVVQAGTRIADIDINNPENKLVGITYFTVEDGKKIQPDMTVQITPQTIKRERFGGIISRATKISSFPTTKEAAARIVGNVEVVEGLVSDKKAGLIQVFAELQPDSNTFSGYQWSSSSGPNLHISSGTTTIARVKIEERAPITYVIPLLRSISGIY